MRTSPHFTLRGKAFSLIELLTVIAIISILAVIAVVGLKGGNSAGKFNKAINDISGILEQARGHAIAQNTYVWVVFYENLPGGSGAPVVRVVSYASNDGTDSFNWAGTVSIPSTALTPITRVYTFPGLHLQTSTLPQAPTSPNIPASVPGFQSTVQSETGPVALSNASAVYWVIQFTPTGAARNFSNPIESIWIGMQPAFSPTVFDTKNIASMKVNGFTGLTTIYRP